MFEGLTTAEVQENLEKNGLNQLPDNSKVTSLRLLLNQFKNFLTIILIVAGVISFLIGSRIDSFLIFIILLLNVILGFWQEFKASKELQTLRKLEVATSRVLRDGRQIEIASIQLVPEDIVLLEAGDRIPADGILVESFELSVNESALTGESLPVFKSTKDKENEVCFSTVVVSGRAKMQIVATGAKTKFGKIALTLSNVEEESTPLEVSLDTLAKKIGILALVISFIFFLFGVVTSQPLFDSFFSSVALLIAIVPEGLPAVITVLLALGVRKMYKRKTLVRKLSAIESLGATNLICTDKTGTLTKNMMSVAEVEVKKDKKTQAMRAGIICNSASLVMKEGGKFDILGDTTEGALLTWALENGMDITKVRKSGKILEEVPFNLKTRMMSVLWQEDDLTTLYSKGAPEVILPICDLSDKEREKLEAIYKEMASRGLRVLALAAKKLVKSIKNEKDLEFLALVGIADEAREEAYEAIAKARKAGIEVVMITGDNELTAEAIGKQVGLLREGDEILLGSQLDELTDEELKNRLGSVRIFARVVPEHKLRIVQAYQSIGKVVAVTGDGVNDSLALKQAHIGVAMGTTGTDVAKEAADIIILDDNLSTIVSSVEEGRVIYANILKVVKFLLAGNLSEVLLIVISILAGYPTPLLPVQLLWINFVTDGFPALSLAADPASKNVMSRPPRDVTQPILSGANLRYILISGFIVAAFNVVVFVNTFHLYDLQMARNVVFTTLMISQFVLIFIIRRHHSIFSNKYLFYSIGVILIAQLLILFNPTLQSVFKIK